MGYRIIEHTADTGIEAEGKTLEDLFAYAALGLSEIVYGPQAATGKDKIIITLEGTDSENLLVRWLSEILHNIREGYLFTGFKINEIEDNKLTAVGTALRDQGLALKTEIKMVTYHGLKIEKREEGFKARIIFDV